MQAPGEAPYLGKQADWAIHRIREAFHRIKCTRPWRPSPDDHDDQGFDETHCVQESTLCA